MRKAFYRSLFTSAIIVTVGFMFLGVALSQTAPADPSPLSATAVSSSEVNLTWQDTANENGFLLFRSTVSDFSDDLVIFNPAQNAVSYSDTGLSAGTTYYYQIYACNAAGCTASNVASATTQPASVPAEPQASVSGAGGVQTQSPPTDLKATPDGACAIKLDWQPPLFGQVNKYQYDVGSGWIDIDNTWLSDEGNRKVFYTYKTRRPTEPNRPYEFRVRACPLTGDCSASSNSAQITTPSIEDPPSPPTNVSNLGWVTATNGGERVTLSWLPTAGDTLYDTIRGFRVERSDDNADYAKAEGGTVSLEWFKSASGKSANTWSNGVTSDILRKYRVRTYQTGRNCVRSDYLDPARQAVTNDTTENLNWIKFSSALSNILIVPAKPPLNGIDVGANGLQATFKWHDVTEEDFYKFELSDNSNFPSSSLRPESKTYPTNATKTDPVIFTSANQQFYYRIKACVGNPQNVEASWSCSNWSGGQFRTGYTPPEDLRGALTSISAGKGSASLNWTDNASYVHRTEIQRKKASESIWQTVGTLDPEGIDLKPKTTFSDSNLDLVKYDYGVRFVALDNNNQPIGRSDWASTQINLNVTPIKGWAWGGGGLGWIRLSNNSLKSAWGDAVNPPNESAVPYTVYVENDPPYNLSGYAWSPYAGWLSFNDEGCPDGITSGCRAKVLGAPTDQIRRLEGFAKFVSDGAGRGLNQWVSLAKRGSEPDYGLYYATTSEGTATVGVLRGLAWGSGPALGWVTFGGPVLKEVKELSSGEVAARGQEIRDKLGREPQGIVVELTWDNPTGYSRVEIWRKLNTGQTFPRDPIESFTDGINIQPGSGKKAVVDGQEPNKTYQFFVRGYLR